ncbi:MAG: HAD-IIIC family phosphatase [Acidimicrobiales bacterium]
MDGPVRREEAVRGVVPTGVDPGSTSEQLRSPVKLIVWDLDDTLWSGTLSEGPVDLGPSRVDLVRTLNDRGIVNAICSKNDLDMARARLEQDDLWDEFVFARIDWSPKGPRVAQIVDDAQLRAENVLFIDDSPSMRGEVRHFVPGIQTAGPEVIDHLLGAPHLSGKDDRRRSRLHQYRLLERKLADRMAARGPHEVFLRSCDIHLAIHHDLSAQSERLIELVNRTHQLNFTKRRLDAEELFTISEDPRRRAGYVTVRDRYGDYGICGFYSFGSDGSLTDFLFSCRVLHMGVEQWLYQHLGRPELVVAGDVVSSLGATVDWITLDSEDAGPAMPEPSAGRSSLDPQSTPTQPDRILMVGGCDLNTTAQFLGGAITTEFAHNAPSGTFVHVGHTETLRQSAVGLTEEQRVLVDRIPFLDQSVYASAAVVDPDFDVLVYSVLTDYTQGLYRHRATGLIAPWMQFNVDITDPAVWPGVEFRLEREGIDRSFLAWFATEFEFLGGISVGRFEDNLRWLADTIPGDARLILVNGAEVELDNPREPERHRHHALMNAVVDRVASTLPNAAVCDVRRFVLSPEDCTDGIRHYQRHGYLRMAEEIRALGSDHLDVRPEPWVHRAFSTCYSFAGRRRVDVRRAIRRARGLPVSPRR